MPLQEAPPTSGVAPGPTAAPVATGPVTLTATEEVWLRVYETDGERLLEKTMTPGERYVVPATAERPQILTGRPNALRVTVGTTEIPPLGPAEPTFSDVTLAPAALMAPIQPPPPPCPPPPPSPPPPSCSPQVPP